VYKFIQTMATGLASNKGKTHSNINWIDVQRKNVVNNVDLYAKFKGTMTKWPIQKQTHRTTQKHL